MVLDLVFFQYEVKRLAEKNVFEIKQLILCLVGHDNLHSIRQSLSTGLLKWELKWCSK